MHIYRVQHGAAKSEADDPQRSLTDEGRHTVERIADFLASINLTLTWIEHSDKLRARQTAAILAERLHCNEVRQVAGMAPHDDIEPLRTRLQREFQTIMLVGHLPHFSRLTARLLGLDANKEAVRFQMGGVVRLDRDDAGQWFMRWVLTPELLPR